MKTHQYTLNLKWTGNEGKGTESYHSYLRDHSIYVEGKSQIIKGSSDPTFLGDEKKYNPEELFLSSIASCHMLWYLHLCTTKGINVQKYEDQPIGAMIEEKSGRGAFKKVILRPHIYISDENNIAQAIALHQNAHEMCFIANSCNFPITIEPFINKV